MGDSAGTRFGRSALRGLSRKRPPHPPSLRADRCPKIRGFMSQPTMNLVDFFRHLITGGRQEISDAHPFDSFSSDLESLVCGRW